jgi:hypothetical protein
VSPLDARVAVLAAELRRDWELVTAHLRKARSVEPARGKPDAALVAL